MSSTETPAAPVAPAAPVETPTPAAPVETPAAPVATVDDNTTQPNNINFEINKYYKIKSKYLYQTKTDDVVEKSAKFIGRENNGDFKFEINYGWDYSQNKRDPPTISISPNLIVTNINDPIPDNGYLITPSKSGGKKSRAKKNTRKSKRNRKSKRYNRRR